MNLSSEQCKKIYDALDISKLDHTFTGRGCRAKISGLTIEGIKKPNYVLNISTKTVIATPENFKWYKAIVDKLYDLNDSWRAKLDQIEENTIITIIDNL